MTKNEARLTRALGLLRQARLLCEYAGASRAAEHIAGATYATQEAVRAAAAPPPRRRLTRHEQLEGLADRGTDTWEDYRGDK